MNETHIGDQTRPTVLVTGCAGFVGCHFSRRLLELGYPVLGLDNLNDYYDVSLKWARLKELGLSDGQLGGLIRNEPAWAEDKAFIFYWLDLKDREALEQLFERHEPMLVVHLGAQAGVRYSLQNPYAYVDSNLSGFINILENCRHHKVQHLVFASSSSVYGANTEMPFSAHHNVDHPVSLYAATKKANELMAHSYAHLYGLPATGLRFFTVYGPWGRPDMAYFMFTRKILAGEPIDVFNNGRMKRDFTYIDDIVEGVRRVMLKPARADESWRADHPDPASSSAPYRIFNIGNHQPVDLLYFISLLEKNLGRSAEKRLLPMQKGDVPDTWADTSALMAYVGFTPSTPVEEGIARFVEWYKGYYGITG